MAFFWVVAPYLPDYTVLQPRRQPSSYSPPWEPQILPSIKFYQNHFRRFGDETDWHDLPISLCINLKFSLI
jgi:hypothetical protein